MSDCLATSFNVQGVPTSLMSSLSHVVLPVTDRSGCPREASAAPETNLPADGNTAWETFDCPTETRKAD